MSHAMGVKCPRCGRQTQPDRCPEGCPLGHGSTYIECDDCKGVVMDATNDKSHTADATTPALDATEIGMQDVLRILDGLGTSLFTVRVMRGLSQREVARQTGESFSTVSRVENGADCNLSTARALLAWIANPTEEDTA